VRIEPELCKSTSFVNKRWPLADTPTSSTALPMVGTDTSGCYTNKAYTEQAKALAEKKKQAADAAAWCVKHDKRECAAAGSGLFPLVSRGRTRTAFRDLEHSRGAAVRDHHNQLMT